MKNIIAVVLTALLLMCFLCACDVETPKGATVVGNTLNLNDSDSLTVVNVNKCISVLTVELEAIFHECCFEDISNIEIRNDLGRVKCDIGNSDTDASDGRLTLIFSDEQISSPDNIDPYVLWITIEQPDGVANTNGLCLE